MRRVQLLYFFAHTHASFARASVAGRELSVSIRRGVGIEHSNIEEGSFKGPTPE